MKVELSLAKAFQGTGNVKNVKEKEAHDSKGKPKEKGDRKPDSAAGIFVSVLVGSSNIKGLESVSSKISGKPPKVLNDNADLKKEGRGSSSKGSSGQSALLNVKKGAASYPSSLIEEKDKKDSKETSSKIVNDKKNSEGVSTLNVASERPSESKKTESKNASGKVEKAPDPKPINEKTAAASDSNISQKSPSPTSGGNGPSEKDGSTGKSPSVTSKVSELSDPTPSKSTNLTKQSSDLENVAKSDEKGVGRKDIGLFPKSNSSGTEKEVKSGPSKTKGKIENDLSVKPSNSARIRQPQDPKLKEEVEIQSGTISREKKTSSGTEPDKPSKNVDTSSISAPRATVSPSLKEGSSQGSDFQNDFKREISGGEKTSQTKDSSKAFSDDVKVKIETDRPANLPGSRELKTNENSTKIFEVSTKKMSLKKYDDLPQVSREGANAQNAPKAKDVSSTSKPQPIHVTQQISESIVKALQNQKPPIKVQIQLSPPSLGKVAITVVERTGGTSLILSSDNTKTQEMLKNAAPVMVNQLSNLNFNVISVQVNGQWLSADGGNHQGGNNERNNENKDKKESAEKFSDLKKSLEKEV